MQRWFVLAAVGIGIGIEIAVDGHLDTDSDSDRGPETDSSPGIPRYHIYFRNSPSCACGAPDDA